MNFIYDSIKSVVNLSTSPPNNMGVLLESRQELADELKRIILYSKLNGIPNAKPATSSSAWVALYWGPELSSEPAGTIQCSTILILGVINTALPQLC